MSTLSRSGFLIINVLIYFNILLLWAKPRWNHYYIFHKGETIMFDMCDGYRWPWQREKYNALMRFGETEVAGVVIGSNLGSIDKLSVYNHELTQKEINEARDK